MSTETKHRLQQSCKAARFDQVYWNGKPVAKHVCWDYLAEYLGNAIREFCREELKRIEAGDTPYGEEGLAEVVSDAVTDTLYPLEDVLNAVNVANLDEVFQAVMATLGCPGYDNDKEKQR